MTPYDEIYELFLSKIEDYALKNDLQNDLQFAKEKMFDWLKSAIPKFTYCTKDLSQRDEVNQAFTETLNDMEKEILSTLMVVEYLSPKVLRSEYFETYLGSKDFANYSPANQLKQVNNLKKSIKEEADSLMIQYYFMQDV
ncbi:hypothetical protein [Bacillus smithii]|uniref:hypothetical protein n=1 Tax=Bacillus smithii TaxID=1479 RepID=UPI002E2051E5|nr:hypothetical protein [Bacillus smithii]MED4929121.1 hypothetical protein [Bacillus smithii]